MGRTLKAHILKVIHRAARTADIALFLCPQFIFGVIHNLYVIIFGPTVFYEGNQLKNQSEIITKY